MAKIATLNFKLQNTATWNLREAIHSDRKFSNDIELHILEIPKIKNNDIKNDELAHWLMFIDNPDSEEVSKFMEENKFFKQGREEGRAIGKKEKKLEIAKKMLEKNI